MTKSLKGAHLRKEVHLSTVSGVASTKPQLVKWFDGNVDAIDVITTKSFQINPNPGNREPIICEPENGSFGNSVGLRNPGMDVSLPPLEKLREKGLKKMLNVSLSASTPEDFVTLIKAFDEVADSVELNFSCPHAAAGYGASIGCDINIATEYVKYISSHCKDRKSLLLVKLTPNVDDIGAIAKSVINAGADGIVAINTVGPNLYIEKDSGMPILNNKLGGKGGASGKWVFGKAISAVRAIRKAIGDEPIIIGMGGVSSGSDVASMVNAGADAVGLGSVFGKVPQKSWIPFLESMKGDAEKILSGGKCEDSSSKFKRDFNEMEYTPHTVVSAIRHTDDMLILTLSGKLKCKAGEFAFLWLPGRGEKPFSVAHNEPLTFLIRAKGEFTKALFSLKAGDKVYTRGVYGSPLESEVMDHSLLIAGGSGVAVLPLVLDGIEGESTDIDILVGTSANATGTDGKKLFEDYFKKFGPYTVIPDDGKPGRVLDSLEDHVKDPEKTGVYIVGPEKFMAAAAKKLIALGVGKEHIQISLERMTMCGIGMCGECVCGDRLTCQWGTFQSYGYLERNAPELLSL